MINVNRLKKGSVFQIRNGQGILKIHVEVVFDDLYGQKRIVYRWYQKYKKYWVYAVDTLDNINMYLDLYKKDKKMTK